MKYTLISIGDSLTQGFRSLSVCRDFQEDSFPFQIYKSNENKFTSFKMPFIKAPGFPINLEYFLYSLEKFNLSKVEDKKLKNIIATFIYKHTRVIHSIKSRNNNLGIFGFTAKQIYCTSFRNSSNCFDRIMAEIENVPCLSRCFTFFNLIFDALSSLFTRKFISLSFTRIIYSVLCGDKKEKNLSEVEIALNICKEAEKRKSEAIITYWAGANDIIGALLTGKQEYISDIDETIMYIKSTIYDLLEKSKAKVCVADIPDIEHIPFINQDNLKPIFPLYDEMSQYTWNNISEAILKINNGIYALIEEMRTKYADRLELVPMKDFFEKMCKEGYKVQLKNGKVVNITSDYIDIDSQGALKKGGFFSMDGVHPTATGYALVANEFIKGFFKMGLRLEKVNIDEIAKKDVLINTPPKLLPQFLEANSYLNNIIRKLGFYDYIDTFMMAQFNLKERDKCS